MELRRQIAILRGWAWLIVACVVLAGSAAYLISASLPKTYESRTVLIVGQSLSSVNPNYDALLASQRLSQTYITVATTRPILQQVIDQLGLQTTPDDLRNRISANAPSDSTVLNITASDGDSQRAADIANALAAELIAQSPAIQGHQADIQQFVDNELAATQQQIQQDQSQIDTLAGLQARTADQDGQLQLLENQVAQLRSTYSTLLQSSSDSAANLLTVVDPAVPASDPSSPRVLLNTILAAVLGLLLAIGAVFVVDYLDDTLKSVEEVYEVAGVATLGMIPRIRPERGATQSVTTLAAPRSPASEAYRTLRTNLGFASVDRQIRTFVVTSALPGEGKTTTACNLAVVFAQTGKTVILLDADLRRPGVHTRFELSNASGLTNLLRPDAPSIETLLQPVARNLRVLTTGPLPPNPAEILGSQKMKEILRILSSDAELVIIDSPPIQAVSDAAILAGEVDGTLLVIRAGQTRTGAVRAASESLERVGTTVLGAVLNWLPEGRGAYYYYRGYSGSYGQSGTSDRPTTDARNAIDGDIKG